MQVVSPFNVSNNQPSSDGFADWEIVEAILDHTFRCAKHDERPLTCLKEMSSKVAFEKKPKKKLILSYLMCPMCKPVCKALAAPDSVTMGMHLDSPFPRLWPSETFKKSDLPGWTPAATAKTAFHSCWGQKIAGLPAVELLCRRAVSMRSVIG